MQLLKFNKYFTAGILLLLIFLFTGIKTSVLAQAYRRCATMEVMEQEMQRDPSLRQKVSDIEKAVYQKTRTAAVRSAKEIITIPVVVHILYNTPEQNISDAQVLSQIEVLNEDFRLRNEDTTEIPDYFKDVAADVGVEFCLAVRDPDGNITSGITRTQTDEEEFFTNSDMKYSSQGGVDAWNTYEYLNIWVCNLANDILGFAQFPGAGKKETDGVVIGNKFFGKLGPVVAPYDNGRTTTHEVGHWLGMYHTFDGGCAGTTSADCLSKGDKVCDTPPTADSHLNCPGETNSCNETPVDLNDMTMNFMEYVDDTCMHLFTEGQKVRMLNMIETIRPNLKDSKGCILYTVDASIASIETNGLFNCGTEVAPVINIKNMGFDSLTALEVHYALSDGNSGKLNWTGAITSFQTEQMPLPVFSFDPGTYTLKVYVQAASDQDSSNDSLEVTFKVIGETNETLPYLEEVERIDLADKGWLNRSSKKPGWTTTNRTGAFNESSYAFFLNYDAMQDIIKGETFELFTPAIELNGENDLFLHFDVAYQKAGKTDEEKMRIYISTDCGKRWEKIYETINFGMKGINSTITDYVPKATDWKSISVDLSEYSGTTSSAIFKFESLAGGGHNLYLDNIAVNQAKPFKSNQISDFKIFPNPNNGRFSLQFESVIDYTYEVRVYDRAGQAILITDVQSFNQPFYEIKFNNLAKGIYFVEVKNRNRTKTSKFFVCD